MLLKERSDINWQLKLIQDAWTEAADANKDIMSCSTTYDPDSLQSKRLKEREYKFKVFEQKLEMQQKALQTRLQQVEAQLNNAESEINSAISQCYGSGK